MEEIIKLIESTEIYKNSISNNLKKEYQDYHYDIDLKIITELHKKAKALQLKQTGVMRSDIVSDEELNKAFENTNYGNRSKRDIIIETLEKVAQSWHCGHTSIEIVKYLELAVERNNSYGLTNKGLKYLLCT